MDNSTEQTPKYRVIGYTDDGMEVREYADGSKRDSKGRLLSLPERLESHLITSENAHDYHKARKAKILQSIEQSVMDVTKTRLPSDAIGAIVGKRAQIAMTDDSRVGNEAAKIVLQAIDAYQNRVDTSTNVLRNELVLDDNTRALLERLAQMKRDDDEIIDV